MPPNKTPAKTAQRLDETCSRHYSPLLARLKGGENINQYSF